MARRPPEALNGRRYAAFSNSFRIASPIARVEMGSKLKADRIEGSVDWAKKARKRIPTCS